jgi:RND family efflux transporter MFP subunit
MIQKKILALALCAALCGCTATEETAVAEKSILVALQTVGRKDISYDLSFPGQVFAAEQIPVVGKLAGKVEEVFFATGDAVSAGDVLFTMDVSDIEDNIKSLEAQILSADAAIRAAQTGVSLSDGSQMQSQILQSKSAAEQAQTGVVQAENGVRQAESALEQAKAGVTQREQAVAQTQISFDTAQTAYNNMKILYDGGVISENDYNQAQTQYDIASNALEQAKTALSSQNISVSQAETALENARRSLDQARASSSIAQESLQISSGVAPEESRRRAEDALAQAQAQKASLLVSLETANKKLEDAKVTSPLDGVVSVRSVEPQTMLSVQTVPFTIIQTNTVEARIHVTESIINKLSVGGTAPVRIDAADSEPFIGEIISLSPAAAPAFEVRLSIPNANGLIKPGMYAQATFTREISKNCLVIPRAAVLEENNERVVYTVETDGRAKRHVVDTGIDNGDEIEIKNGLNDGAAIVVKGQNYLRDGALTVVEEGRN